MLDKVLRMRSQTSALAQISAARQTILPFVHDLSFKLLAYLNPNHAMKFNTSRKTHQNTILPRISSSLPQKKPAETGSPRCPEGAAVDALPVPAEVVLEIAVLAAERLLTQAIDTK